MGSKEYFYIKQREYLGYKISHHLCTYIVSIYWYSRYKIYAATLSKRISQKYNGSYSSDSLFHGSCACVIWSPVPMVTKTALAASTDEDDVELDEPSEDIDDESVML